MSTRAVYTFIDDRGSHSVYKHHDGYPTGAAGFISRATANAWALPRFEADEFAAAFVAVNKKSEGGVRLTSGPEAHGDLHYRYEVRCQDGALQVDVIETPMFGNGTEKRLWVGSLAEMPAWAEKFERQIAAG